jgi:peptidoglycan/xylan/chitin deacetylase (PgdA/CDA1 family)
MFALAQKISSRMARHFHTATLRAHNIDPIVSFTFDDAPTSAATDGARILEDFGVRGSFYLSGGLIGGHSDILPILSASQARELAQRGHEIGCHTFGHLEVQEQTWPALEDDLDRNRQCLTELSGAAPKNFAYPYGHISYAMKRRLQARFATCRSVDSGINEAAIDLGLLKAVPLYEAECGYEEVVRWIAANVERTGWLIFVTHDVQERPTPYGTTPKLIMKSVRAAISAGCACLTVERALERIRRPERGDSCASAAFSLREGERETVRL